MNVSSESGGDAETDPREGDMAEKKISPKQPAKKAAAKSDSKATTRVSKVRRKRRGHGH
jgi:hypothetical protein